MRWPFGQKPKEKETTDAPEAHSGSEWDFLRSRPDFDEEEMASTRRGSGEPAPAAAPAVRKTTVSPSPARGTPPPPRTTPAVEATPPEEAPVSSTTQRLKVEVVSGRRRFNWVVREQASVGRRDFSAGSHPEIDLFLDPGVELQHAEIARENGRFILRDLGSPGGTRKNGQPLEPGASAPLQVGDRIDLGEHSMIRVLEAPGPSTLTVEDVILSEMLQGAIGAPAQE